MKPRTLAILALVVAALGGFVWFIEGDLPGSDERRELADRVVGASAEELTALEWSVASGATVRIERGEVGWRLLSPVTGHVDGVAVDSLLAALTGLTRQRTLEDAAAAEAALSSPEATVTYEAGLQRETLRFGPSLPASDSRLVAGTAGEIWVVTGDLLTELERPLDEWRDRDLWSGEVGEVESVVLEGGDSPVTIVRSEDGFRLEGPVVDVAHGGTVSRFIGSLASLEAKRFVDDSDGDFGLMPPRAAVELTTREGETWRLEVGGTVLAETEDPLAAADGTVEVYAKVGEQIVIVDDPLSSAVERSIDDWRSHDWTQRQAFEIDRLRIVDGVRSVTLGRGDSGWLRDGTVIVDAPVLDLVYAVTGVKGEGLDAVVPPSEPLLTIVIGVADEEETLAIYPAVDDRHPATRSGREASLWVGGDSYRDLLAKVKEVVEAPAPEAADDGSDAAPELLEPAVDDRP